MNAPTETVALKIGDAWHEGIYAGRSIHENEPVELVLLPEEFSGNWKNAIAWAKAQGGELPSRIDLLVLWQNLCDQFKPDWYWSAEQYAGDASFAWYQSFDDGYQTSSHQYGELRARAVRRITI